MMEIDDGYRNLAGGKQRANGGWQDEFRRGFDHVGPSVNEVLHALEPICIAAAVHCAKKLLLRIIRADLTHDEFHVRNTAPYIEDEMKYAT